MTLALSSGMWTAIGFAAVYFLLSTALVLSLCPAAKNGDRLLREARARTHLAAGAGARASRSRRDALTEKPATGDPPPPPATPRGAEPRLATDHSATSPRRAGEPGPASIPGPSASPNVAFDPDEWNARFYGRTQ